MKEVNVANTNIQIFIPVEGQDEGTGEVESSGCKAHYS